MDFPLKPIDWLLLPHPAGMDVEQAGPDVCSFRFPMDDEARPSLRASQANDDETRFPKTTSGRRGLVIAPLKH